jgi:hypothetical protein
MGMRQSWEVPKFAGRREALQSQGLEQFVIPDLKRSVAKGRDEEAFRRQVVGLGQKTIQYPRKTADEET